MTCGGILIVSVHVTNDTAVEQTYIGCGERMCRIHGDGRVLHHDVLYLNTGLTTISIRHAETHVPVVCMVALDGDSRILNLDVLEARIVVCLADKYAVVVVLTGGCCIGTLNSQRWIEKGKVLCLGMLGTGATRADKETILPVA